MSNPFTPAAATVSRAATSTTANVALGTIPCLSGGTVRIYNAGPNTAFIEFGGTSAIEAATATSMPIPSGAIETFSRGPSVTHMAAICAASQTATVYATPGNGE